MFYMILSMVVGMIFAQPFREGMSPASERVRSFPADKCQYTLPSSEWYWDSAPEVRPLKSGRPLLKIRNFRTPVSLRIRVIDLKENEGEKPGYYESFKRGLLSASKHSREIEWEHVKVEGIPSYQFELETAGIARSTVRLILANNKLYFFILAYPAETQNVDTKTIFAGFRFSQPPVPVSKSPYERSASAQSRAEQEGRELGQDAAPLVGIVVLLLLAICFFAFVVLVIYLCVRKSR